MQLKSTLKALATTWFSLAASASFGQSTAVVYGNIDVYLNYLHSSSGTSIKSLEDGALQRSRIGFRGTEDLGNGISAKFQLEGGFSTDNGAVADTTRFFDRQSWVGLATPYGEFRLGRTPSAMLVRGSYVDYTNRDLGSMVNNFGVPSRYDNEFVYVSPRVKGVLFEGHLSLPETTLGNRPFVYQAALEYGDDTYKFGYMGLRGRPQRNAPIHKDVVYDNIWFDWLYGQGTVYLFAVRSNNATATDVSSTAGTILGNTGGFNAGTNPDLNSFFNIYQVSADYRVTGQLRIGGLWGVIKDTSGRSRGATGGSIGAYYDLSKRTMLLALVDTINNSANGGWRPAGSAGLKTNFTNPADIAGRRINGAQLGIVHRF